MSDVLTRLAALEDVTRLLVRSLAQVTIRDDETRDLNLQRLERAAIVEALKRTAGQQAAAARLLGVSERVLNYRMQQAGLPRKRGAAPQAARHWPRAVSRKVGLA